MPEKIQNEKTVNVDQGDLLSPGNRLKLRKTIAQNLVFVNANDEVVHPRNGIYVRWTKRILDFLVALVALILTFPVNFVLGICTFFDVGWPIFFRQTREGKNCQPFTIVKFRNMNNKRDENGNLLPGKERVTKLGKIVRKASLDELLNFWSVLKGDMSLIGPRPLVREYTAFLSERHQKRYAVRPGLECPMMIHTDEYKTWSLQFDNDVWYVEHVSFAVDIKMVFALIRMTFNRKTSKMRGNAVRGSFMGYNPDGTSINSHSVPAKYIVETFGEAQNGTF